MCNVEDDPRVEDDQDSPLEPPTCLAPGPFEVAVVDHPRPCYLCGLHLATATNSTGKVPVCEACTPLLKQRTPA